MVKRVFLLLLLTVGPLLALRPTVKLTVRGPQTAVAAVKAWLDEQIAANQARLIIAGTGDVVPIEDDVDSSDYEFSAFLQFESEAAAKAAKQDAWNRRNQLLKNVHGSLLFHLCPEEGEVTTWEGCSKDIRAKYEAISF